MIKNKGLVSFLIRVKEVFLLLKKYRDLISDSSGDERVETERIVDLREIIPGSFNGVDPPVYRWNSPAPGNRRNETGES